MGRQKRRSGCGRTPARTGAPAASGREPPRADADGAGARRGRGAAARAARCRSARCCSTARALLAVSGNRTEELADPTAHAEMLVIRAAAHKLGRPRLAECDLYVTLEPCPMCAQAISFARIRRLYYGAADPKGGGVEHGPRIFASTSCHHRPEVYGGIGERGAARCCGASMPANQARVDARARQQGEHPRHRPGQRHGLDRPASRP